ncbi:MAG TPA: Minf_1886 family protein [Gemmatimonadales bacterium]|jgi:uncharacterized repeat protein (TIGR04138 family)
MSGLAVPGVALHFPVVFDMHLADEFVARIRAVDGRYHERAYLFVLASLEQCQRRRRERGHIRGRELAEACRDVALEQFGLAARLVLQHWGIDSTEAIGRIVYVLIEVGLLVRHPDDRIEDFEGVYDFGRTFDVEYPWAGVARTQTV